MSNGGIFFGCSVGSFSTIKFLLRFSKLVFAIKREAKCDGLRTKSGGKVLQVQECPHGTHSHFGELIGIVPIRNFRLEEG